MYRPRNTAIALGLSAALTTGACSPATPQLRRTACESFQIASDNFTDAEQCDTMLHSGKVALVAMDGELSMKDGRRAASTLQTALQSLSHGAVTMTVETFNASPETQQAYEAATPGSCVDTRKPAAKRSGARIADIVMRLSAYDVIVGISPKSSCNYQKQLLGEGAITNAAYIDVLGFPSSILQPDTEEQSEQQMVSTLHELFHTYGIGHAGALILPEQNNPFVSALENHGSIDIFDIVSRSLYDEYGDSFNVQGAGLKSLPKEIAADDYTKLSPLQIDWLQRAGQIAHRQSSIVRREFKQNPLRILASDQPGTFISLPLERPITPGDMGGIHYITDFGEKARFTTLAVLPESWNGDTRRATLFLEDTLQHSTVKVGSVEATTAAVWDIRTGDKTMQISFGKGSLLVLEKQS